MPGALVLALGGAAGDLAVGQGIRVNGNIAAHTLGCTGELAGHACGGGGRLAAAAVAQQADAHNSRHGQRSHALADLILFPLFHPSCFGLLVFGYLSAKNGGSCSFGKQFPLAELRKDLGVGLSCSNSAGNGSADHGVVAHADQTHHLNVCGHRRGACELSIAVHTAQESRSGRSLRGLQPRYRGAGYGRCRRRKQRRSTSCRSR